MFIDKIKQLGEQSRLVKAFELYLAENGAKVTQSKSLADVSFYHSLTIGTGTSGTFFRGDASTANTNLDQFTRPEGEHVAITAIQLLEGNNATIGDTDWIPATAGADWAKNGYFTIYSNGVKVADKIPATDFLKEVESDQPATKELTVPIFWAGQTSLEVKFESTKAGASSDNLRVVLKGIGLV
jgi:hypothetical protein